MLRIACSLACAHGVLKQFHAISCLARCSHEIVIMILRSPACCLVICLMPVQLTLPKLGSPAAQLAASHPCHDNWQLNDFSSCRVLRPSENQAALVRLACSSACCLGPFTSVHQLACQ